jgi:hypothetical protein
MEKRTLPLLVICGLVVLVALVTSASLLIGRVHARAYDTQPAAGTVYHIVNRNSNKLLEVYNGIQQDTALVDQHSATGCTCQNWAFCVANSSTQPNAFYLYNVGTSGGGTHYVLHVPYSATVLGVILEQYHQASGDPSEEWQVIAAQDNGQDNGYVYLQNVNSHLVADDYLFSGYDMSAVEQWSYNGGQNVGYNNQQWQLQPVSGASPFTCP